MELKNRITIAFHLGIPDGQREISRVFPYSGDTDTIKSQILDLMLDGKVEELLRKELYPAQYAWNGEYYLEGIDGLLEAYVNIEPRLYSHGKLFRLEEE